MENSNPKEKEMLDIPDGVMCVVESFRNVEGKTPRLIKESVRTREDGSTFTVASVMVAEVVQIWNRYGEVDFQTRYSYQPIATRTIARMRKRLKHGEPFPQKIGKDPETGDDFPHIHIWIHESTEPFYPAQAPMQTSDGRVLTCKSAPIYQKVFPAPIGEENAYDIILDKDRLGAPKSSSVLESAKDIQFDENGDEIIDTEATEVEEESVELEAEEVPTGESAEE